MVEQWLPVPGYEGYYDVSSLGLVWSRYGRGRFLKPWANPQSGYLCVNLSRDRTHRQRTIHSLVAEAFIGPRPEGLETRHLDGQPTNNAVSNLAYGTPTENAMDLVRLGIHHNAIKTHCPFGHPYSDANTIRGKRGHRRCRTCHNRRVQEYAARRKAG